MIFHSSKSWLSLVGGFHGGSLTWLQSDSSWGWGPLEAHLGH